eukprot:scaffold206878_cov37-Tisochrysis_lutea.AAC.4
MTASKLRVLSLPGAVLRMRANNLPVPTRYIARWAITPRTRRRPRAKVPEYHLVYSECNQKDSAADKGPD